MSTKEIKSPRKAISERCLNCCGGDLNTVYKCQDQECYLWERRYTNGTKKRDNGKTMPVLKSIKAYCLECCLGQSNEVKLCPAEKCPLHNFRFGKNPFVKIELSDEEKQKRIENVRKSHGK